MSNIEDSTMAAPAGSSAAPAASAPQGDNITVGQRMISATAGNILTGLLGESTRQQQPLKSRTNHRFQSRLSMSCVYAYSLKVK